MFDAISGECRHWKRHDDPAETFQFQNARCRCHNAPLLAKFYRRLWASEKRLNNDFPGVAGAGVVTVQRFVLRDFDCIMLFHHLLPVFVALSESIKAQMSDDFHALVFRPSLALGSDLRSRNHWQHMLLRMGTSTGIGGTTSVWPMICDKLGEAAPGCLVRCCTVWPFLRWFMTARTICATYRRE